MEKKVRTLDLQSWVGGILLAQLVKFQGLKGQTASSFDLFKDMLPNFHFVICEDCWGDSLLEDVLVRHGASFKEKHYLVVVFESGKITCKDVKKKSEVVKSEGNVEEKGDSQIITFLRSPKLDSEKDLQLAYDKFKSSIKNFDGLLKIVETKLAQEASGQIEGIEVVRLENGIQYNISPAKWEK